MESEAQVDRACVCSNTEDRLSKSETWDMIVYWNYVSCDPYCREKP